MRENKKKITVLSVAQGDRLDSPAGVIRSLFQADPFPCSVASLGRTDLFKALEFQTYVRNPMATQNLIRAPGKRQISTSPQPLTSTIQRRSRITGCTQAIGKPSTHFILSTSHLLYLWVLNKKWWRQKKKMEYKSSYLFLS